MRWPQATHWAAPPRGAESRQAWRRASGCSAAEAGAHWERASTVSGTPGAVGADLPRLYVRAVDAAVIR
jgi:hypothetical protein